MSNLRIAGTITPVEDAASIHKFRTLAASTTAKAQPIFSLIPRRLSLLIAYLIATVAILVQTSGCASYHLGSQFLYRSDIRTVHVVMFENETFRRYLGQRQTEAVIKEVELNTPLTITDPQIADSFIHGRIISTTKRVAGKTIDGDPRTLAVGWVVEVDWTDRAGVPLMQRQSIRINNDAEFVPEGGQSMATAQQRIIEQTARDIISQMQMPW